MTIKPSVVGVPNNNAIANVNGVPAILSSDWRRYLTQGLLSSAGPASQFTPSFGGMTPTYVVQQGYWQRTGNLVFIWLYIRWTGGTNGEALSVNGLPYPSPALQVMPVLLNSDNASLTWTGTPVAVLQNYACAIKNMASGASATSIQNVNAGTKDLCITGTYRV